MWNPPKKFGCLYLLASAEDWDPELSIPSSLFSFTPSCVYQASHYGRHSCEWYWTYWNWTFHYRSPHILQNWHHWQRQETNQGCHSEDFQPQFLPIIHTQNRSYHTITVPPHGTLLCQLVVPLSIWFLPCIQIHLFWLIRYHCSLPYLLHPIHACLLSPFLA